MTARHKWDRVPTMRSGRDCTDGNERNERGCCLCDLTKVTVIPPHGRPWRAWRRPGGAEFFADATPPCPGAAVSAEPVKLREAS